MVRGLLDVTARPKPNPIPPPYRLPPPRPRAPLAAFGILWGPRDRERRQDRNRALSIAGLVLVLTVPNSFPLRSGEPASPWRTIAPFFDAPEAYRDDPGDYRSPLQFYDGTPVRGSGDWIRRRSEILRSWHELMGAWPPVIEDPEVDFLDSAPRENFDQHRVRFAITPEEKTDAYLLVPRGLGRRPAVLVVFYEPETGIGKGKEYLDFAYQLARRGFVTLSMGHGASIYYPDREKASLQPLSALAHAAANAYHVLARHPNVDPQRIGIVGHSYGGKWAMFASCLYDRFACAAWSDGGVVFDESRANVNYWEPWYLGHERGKRRREGIPDASNPRTGAYRKLMEGGFDLHELHALMAPRPFLVSGGSEDRPARWKALNHAVAVNRLLGHENRVAMTNRERHSPNAESNEKLYAFFEHFLMSGSTSVLDTLEKRARDVLGARSHPTTADLPGRAPSLRRKLIESLGIDHLGEARARDVRKVGLIEREDHVIEKIVYRTLPRTEVPAHVYRPRGLSGRRPAILFVPGHWWADSKARENFQAFCVNMARRGFVVLSYDPIGQGERGVSFRDHRRTAALLLGVSQQGMVAFESRCALDLLLSRDDVDPDRIGITGASGGGYNSWIMTAIDSRIAAAVPVVGTSEFHEQLHVCRPLDWYRAKEHCHFVPELFGYANNHELLALAWPRPVLVIAAAGDQSFPLPGIRRVVAYGRKLYAPSDAPRSFDAFEDHAEGHGYQKAKREAAYGWFERWLGGKGDASPISEPATKTVPFDAPELRCFTDGKRAAGPGIVATLEALLAELPSETKAPDHADLRRSLALALGLESGIAAPSAKPSIQLGGYVFAGALAGRELVWATRDGLRIPSVLVAPAGEWKGVAVALDDEGKRSALESVAVAEALEAGLAVVAADVRGIGELAVGERGWVFAVSLLLGENFVGRQALDLVDGVGALATLDGVGEKPIGLLALGPVSSLAALYAATLDERVAWLVSEGGFVSYRSWIRRPRSLRRSYTLAASRDEAWKNLDEEIPHELFIFDVLRRFDLGDLYRSLAPRPTLILKPIDGDWQALSKGDAARLLRQGTYRFDETPRVIAGDPTRAALRAFLRSEP